LRWLDFLTRRCAYCEEITPVQLRERHWEIKTDLRLTDIADQRLPGGRIELELLPVPPGGRMSNLEQQRHEMIEDHLRLWLRECGDRLTTPA
jgi:hypothetical protein